MRSNGFRRLSRSYAKGMEITGLADAAADKDVVVFHAGTKADGAKFLPTADVCLV